MNEILELKNISKSHDKAGTKLNAVQDFSLTLASGKVLGIAGESGCGKSTLLRLISGLEAPDSGEILLNSAPLNKKRSLSELRKIQMIFQDPKSSFHPAKSISASLRDASAALLGKHPEPDFETRIQALMSQLGLSEQLLLKRPAELSGGECQRFALARALLAAPEILLADEAVSSLDPETRGKIIRLLATLKSQNNMTMIFVSHDLSVLSEIADRIIIMRNGKIIETGKTKEIFENPQSDYTKLLLSSILRI